MLKYKKELIIITIGFSILLYFLTILIKYDSDVYLFNIHPIKQDVIKTDLDLPVWDKTKLIDIYGFEYISFHKICNESIILNLLVLVHSAPGNIKKRMAIRETWGKSVPGMKLLFMMGAIRDNDLQTKINCENDKYQDIIQGNFLDAYKNNTYKHVMCLKYTVYHCSTAKYILKTDDDIYVNMDVLLEFLEEMDERAKDKRLILCSTRAATKVYRSNYKWSVSFNEYVHSQYPTYCLGPAIIYSIEAAYRLYSVAQLSSYFWIDDVHVSGTVAEMAKVKRSNLPPVFLQGNSLKEFTSSNGTRGPIIFFYSFEISPSTMYDLHRAVQNRRKLY